jgi:SNF2 family DNA or RNA helicase
LPEDAKARARQAPTLIVCPLSVITNWEEQIKEHFHPSHPLKYYTYHGPNRMRDVNQLATYDVIITTYNVISQEYGIYTIGNEDDDEQEDDFGDTGAAATTASKKRASKKRKKGKSAAASMLAFDTKEATLFGMEFWRVVLDEGHLIRNSKSKQSLAARALRSERRWALSGTPLVNNLDDAFALLNFIGVPPFTTYARWHQVREETLVARAPLVFPFHPTTIICGSGAHDVTPMTPVSCRGFGGKRKRTSRVVE